MKTAHSIANFLIVLLGCVHVGFTFFNYHGLSYDAIWFFGTGIAIVLAGFVNIALLRDRERDTVIWTMALVTNLLFLIGFGAASYMMREPQVFVGALLFAITTIHTFRIHDGAKH